MRTINEFKAELPNFRFNDYLRSIKTIEKELNTSEFKPLKVAVLRSYTVEMMEPILRLRLYLEGYQPQVFFGDFNQYSQEILDPTSRLYEFEPDVILILVRIEEVLPDMTEMFSQKSYGEWENLVRETAKHLKTLVETIEKNFSAQVLLQNFALPYTPFWGIYDAQHPDGQSRLIYQLNRLITQQLQDKNSTFIWDYNRFLQKIGYESIYDPKMWYIARNPFKQSFIPRIVDDLVKYLFSIIGKSKKCIVLDLDNTLWGGVAGEDGIEGVSLGHDYPGSCFYDFQKGLLKLYNRGIILAINSKNNEEDAFELIDNHPYMMLRREHFAAFKINWRNKVANLRELAQELNIGIDSMIFIDDSPVECELIRQHCPECEVVRLPEKPYLIPGVIDELSGIENIKLTDEDKKKGSMYKAQAERKKFESSIDNLEEFLKGLEMEVVIEPASHFSIPRIAQLTQKTNQMNLTTRRYTEANIQNFIKSSKSSVFAVSSKDRFGDNGIIGVFILKITDKKCLIDTFLLSCRVIARNIEQSIIAYIAEYAKKRGATALIGEYLPTRKNRPAADMYEKFKFEKVDGNLFRANLEAQNFEYPSYIRHIIPQR